jgi:hypothetical protein
MHALLFRLGAPSLVTGKCFSTIVEETRFSRTFLNVPGVAVD